MGPRQTAVNTLSYSTGSRPKAEAGRASAKTIGTGVCERPRRGGPRVRAAAGPTVVRAGRRRLAERQNRFPRR